MLCVIASPFAAIPAKKAQALPVPTACGLFDVYCIMDNWKEFVGNKLAVMIANQLIQRMTASVVNWINTGFEGSPAFITNPEGFFMDVGDQITGELLEKTGALSQLCSPFSFDLRLNIALNQASSMNKRYSCTLSTVINNTRNSVQNIGRNSGITLTGSADGATLGNFMNGDFSQGGWGGFLAYTTQAQNNPVGAYLLADSDLKQKIAERKASVNNDLNRGAGFLSWNKCTDVTNQFTIDPSGGGYDVPADGRSTVEIAGSQYGLNASDIRDLEKNGFGSSGFDDFGKATGIKKTTKNGKTTYQDCSVQTPGSMIAGSLQKQLNIPSDKLVLVKTISDSIDAITGALVNQMFTQGLAALSGHGSGLGGNSKAYLTQLSDESYNQNSFDIQSTKNRSLSGSNSVINLGQDTINQYDQTLSLLSTERTKYVSIRACFSTKISTANFPTSQREYGQRMIGGVDLVLAQSIDLMISSTTEKKMVLQNKIDSYKNTTNSSTNAQIRGVTDNDISAGFNRVDASISSTLQGAQAGVDGSEDATQSKKSVDSLMTILDKDAGTFQRICNELPYNLTFGGFPYHTFVNPLLVGFH